MIYRSGLVAVVALFGLFVGWLVHGFTDLEGTLLDQRLRKSGRKGPDPRIVIAGIDKPIYEQGLFNRSTHAKILLTLQKAGCRVVFFDVLFDEPREPKDDAAFAAALRQSKGVVLAGAGTLNQEHSYDPPHIAPTLGGWKNGGANWLGTIEKQEDEDGRVRRYTMAVGYGSQTVPSAALACYGVLQSLHSGDLRYWDDKIELVPDVIPIVKSEQVGITTYGFPLTFHPGATGPGNVPGPGTYPVIPYSALLEPTPEVLSRLKGAIVMVGENTDGTTDLVKTPVGTIKGVEVHAQALDSLLHKDYYQPASPTAQLSAYYGLTLLVAALGWLSLTLTELTISWLVLSGLYVAVNWWLFQHQIFLELAKPLAGATGAWVCLTAVRLVLSTRFLARFIPREAVHGLLAQQEIAAATNATVIVTDIGGYTTLSESRTAVEMLKLLNEYHSVTVDLYHKFGGSVLTFQGDAQLVVFGYPARLKDAAGQAVKACVAVERAIAELRRKWGIDDPSNFDVGAGCCTGLVYIGDVGSKEQANYTVIGEVVRTSHKVQSMSTALQGNVLLDEPTYQACLDKPNATAIHDVELEGFPDRKTLYRVESK